MLLIFFNYICVYLISARCSTHPPPPPRKKRENLPQPTRYKTQRAKTKTKNYTNFLLTVISYPDFSRLGMSKYRRSGYEISLLLKR